MAELLEVARTAYADYARWLIHEFTRVHSRNWAIWLVGLSLVVLAWEWLRPWRVDQARFRRDFWLDAFYMFFNFFLFGLIVQHAGSEVLVHAFRDALATIGIQNPVAIEIGSWPAWLQIGTLFVLRDFVHWNVHRLLHRVPWLWEFHKVHHSVLEMGFAAHLRFHPMETVVYRVLEYVPLALIGFGVDDFFAAYVLSLAIGHLNHANLVLPLGKLRYVLNNPQMHIWHHAREYPPQMPYGTNFGISLSLWDYLFGTAWVPTSGRDLELGFAEVETFPQGFFGQLATGFRRRSHPRRTGS